MERKNQLMQVMLMKVVGEGRKLKCREGREKEEKLSEKERVEVN